LVSDLQAPLHFQALLLHPYFFDGFSALGQGRLVEQRQQRRKAVAVDQSEDFDIASKIWDT
jgi:hypothetical protein